MNREAMVTQTQALRMLRGSTGDAAVDFMDGQWEAIDSLVNARRRVLLIQRTGWGKSMVYFLATRMLRDAGAGPTLIVSPLLSLMRNQREAATRLGLDAETINSTNRNDWDKIVARVTDGVVDILLISPEQLANTDLVEMCLIPIASRVGFVVIDEAHCISDWGHDFRPDYQRIDRILRQLPADTPVLAATATANDRVVADVLAQLGTGTVLQRGPLARSSLQLQAMMLPDRADRLAWLADALPKLPGSGIVYTLTARDAEQVATWLRSCGIEAEAYHGRVGEDDGGDSSARRRERLEKMLLSNKIKVIVATNALGMGFDKPDLGFVVHFQAPQSIVHYYQQVGRAGRAIASATGVLFGGEEDHKINNFFIANASPPERDVYDILTVLKAAEGGLTVAEISRLIHLRQGGIEKIMKLLSAAANAPVVRTGLNWSRTSNDYQIDRARTERLTRQRQTEWQDVQRYLHTGKCLMKFLGRALDDPTAKECGRCANCLGYPVIQVEPDAATIARAGRFVNQGSAMPAPRRTSGASPRFGFPGKTKPALCYKKKSPIAFWLHSGWARQIDRCKRGCRFAGDLVRVRAKMLRGRWRPGA